MAQAILIAGPTASGKSALAVELARAHGGDLALVRSDGEWTEFVFTIPLHEPEGATT